MNATGAGKWQVICHVANHNAGGMEANYRVYGPNSACPLPPPAEANMPSGTATPLPSTTPVATATIAGGNAQVTDPYTAQQANPSTSTVSGASASATGSNGSGYNNGQGSNNGSAPNNGQGPSNGHGPSNGQGFNNGPAPNNGQGPNQGMGRNRRRAY